MDAVLHNLYDYLINLDYFKDVLTQECMQSLELEGEADPIVADEKLIEVPLDFINA
jgi:hypothetical protein